MYAPCTDFKFGGLLGRVWGQRQGSPCLSASRSKRKFRTLQWAMLFGRRGHVRYRPRRPWWPNLLCVPALHVRIAFEQTKGTCSVHSVLQTLRMIYVSHMLHVAAANRELLQHPAADRGAA